jgi:hypothetical protein
MKAEHRKLSMKPVKRDQVWEVLRGGGEGCEAHVINVVPNRVNLHFRNDHDPAKGRRDNGHRRREAKSRGVPICRRER